MAPHCSQVEDVANAMSPLALNKQLPLQVRVLTDARGVWQYMHADSARLKQVLTNVRRPIVTPRQLTCAPRCSRA